jgi:hypothetical protein
MDCCSPHVRRQGTARLQVMNTTKTRADVPGGNFESIIRTSL